MHFSSSALPSFSKSSVWYLPNFLFSRRTDFISLSSACMPAAANIFFYASLLPLLGIHAPVNDFCPLCVLIFPYYPYYLITACQIELQFWEQSYDNSIGRDDLCISIARKVGTGSSSLSPQKLLRYNLSPFDLIISPLIQIA